MPDVRQLNLLDGFHTGTAQLDGDRFTVRTIETEETATGYVVRFRDGRGPEAREISVNLGGQAAGWLARELRRMVKRFEAEHGDD